MVYIFFSFCFCVVSLLTLIGYFIGDEVSCQQTVYNKTLKLLDRENDQTGNSADWRCTLLSMMLYFFIMAVHLVVRPLCWPGSCPPR